MSVCTIEELKDIMRDTLGDDEEIDFSGDILDVPLIDLGYDSLATLDLAARLRQRFGVVIENDGIDTLLTPRAALDAINGLALAVAA